jgi:TnpA family transposase
VLERLWNGSFKVSYEAFLRGLEETRGRMRRSRQSQLLTPSSPTYSRIWQEFCRERGLKRSSPAHLRRLLFQGLSEGAWDAQAPFPEALDAAVRYLSRRRIIPPRPQFMVTLLRSVHRRARRLRRYRTGRFLVRSMGTTLSALPLARRFRAAHQVLRYPPSSRGKVGVKKLAAEDAIRREIEATLEENHLSIPKLLSDPELESSFEFVERHATSTLLRWERREVVRALPLYLAARHRQAVDTILFVFVRMARLLRLRVQGRSEEQVQESTRALFERGDREFADLRRAILDTLGGADPSGLDRFRPLLQRLEEHTRALRAQETYFLLLARRGSFARKLARRLQGLPFEGHDNHARAVLGALEEVLRFAPFAQRVAPVIRRSLSFLDVPSHRLAQRRIFEAVLLITLADLLWLGRITCPSSERFGDRWAAMPTLEGTGEEILRSVRRSREDLRQTWEVFRETARTQPVVHNGRLVTRRPSKKRRREEEARRQRTQQRFLSGLRPVSVVDVVLSVHRATGMLGAFRLPGSPGRYLTDEARARLALAVVLSRGMNIGIRSMSTLLGRWYTLGRLQNFDESYGTLRNFQEANRILLEAWETRGLGRTWGTGKGVAADGRSVATTDRTLLAGYHFRHRVSGVTLYWLVRDDWVASTVGVIGNHEWESWYLLDGLLDPGGGHPSAWATGDTHGQHLALWGLAFLMGKEVRARFRRLSHVKLYHEGPVGGLPVRGVQSIRWDRVESVAPSLARLVAAVRQGKVRARDLLQMWNLYDEKGRNVTEALRELGKAVRTTFLLGYASREDVRREIHEGCNRAESWNSFQEAVFWGHGGRLQPADPFRQQVTALAMQLVMNSIVFFNAMKFEGRFRQMGGTTPAMWDHVRLFGDYRITLGRRTIGGEPRI